MNILNTVWMFGVGPLVFIIFNILKVWTGNVRTASWTTWRRLAASLLHGRTHRPQQRAAAERWHRGDSEGSENWSVLTETTSAEQRKSHSAHLKPLFIARERIYPRFFIAAERKCKNLNAKRGCLCIFDTWGEAPHLHLVRQVSEDHCRPFLLLSSSS